MATIDKQELVAALSRLGELAAAEGEHVELLLLGGSVMVLAFDARPSTRDVDAVILSPSDRFKVRRLIEIVARERSWPSDWLNEGAKGFLVSPVVGSTLLSLPGLTARMPAIEMMLALKLSAWRDDVDISDAERLLRELSGGREEIWNLVVKHVQPGRELKARYAFDDLWEHLHGSS